MSAAQLDLDTIATRAEAVPDWNITGNTIWVTDYDPSDPTGETPMQRPVGGAEGVWLDHIAAMNPETTLALVDEVRRLRAVEARVMAMADDLSTCGGLGFLSGPEVADGVVNRVRAIVGAAS
jgi:hypothetical protein